MFSELGRGRGLHDIVRSLNSQNSDARGLDEDINVMRNWLFFYDQREKGSPVLWIVGLGCVLATICVFAGFNAVQWAVERSDEFRNVAPQGGSALLRSNSATRLLALGIEGVKFQSLIALALIIRWLGLFTYRFSGLSARRKWVGVVIAEVSLIFAVTIFAWYGWRSHIAFVAESACIECIPPSDVLLGTTRLWGSLLALVILVQTVYGVIRLMVPVIDMIRAKRGATT